jgi:hypothetical protein
MPDSIFGTPVDPASRGGSDDTPSWLKDEEPTTEPVVDEAAEGSPAEEAAPEATPAPATDETQEAPTPQGDLIVQVTPEELEALRAAGALQTEETSPEQPEGESTEVSEAERLYANKYRTVDDLEKGYRERSDMWRRANERAMVEEQARQAAEQRAAQIEEAMRSAVPLLEQAAVRERQMRQWAEQTRQETGSYPQGYEPPAPGQGPPAGLSQGQVQQMLEERLAAERAAMSEQFARQQEATALEAVVRGFYQDHPEVEPDGALDTEITDAMAELNNSPSWGGVRNPDGSYGIIVDPTDRGSVEILYEAAQRPALLEVLKLHPDYFASEAGLTIARRDAAIIEGVPATTAAQTATVPASRAGKRAGQKVPFAESAQGTLPQNQGIDETDDWARIKAVGKRTDRAPSIFQE